MRVQRRLAATHLAAEIRSEARRFEACDTSTDRSLRDYFQFIYKKKSVTRRISCNAVSTQPRDTLEASGWMPVSDCNETAQRCLTRWNWGWVPMNPAALPDTHTHTHTQTNTHTHTLQSVVCVCVDAVVSRGRRLPTFSLLCVLSQSQPSPLHVPHEKNWILWLLLLLILILYELIIVVIII